MEIEKHGWLKSCENGKGLYKAIGLFKWAVLFEKMEECYTILEF